MGLHYTFNCEACGRGIRFKVDEEAVCWCGHVVWSWDDVERYIRQEEAEDLAWFKGKLEDVVGIPAGAIELHSKVLDAWELDEDFYVNYSMTGMVETPLSLVTIPVQQVECETPGFTTFAQAIQ